jgi:hypothetical protein
MVILREAEDLLLPLFRERHPPPIGHPLDTPATINSEVNNKLGNTPGFQILNRVLYRLQT